MPEETSSSSSASLKDIMLICRQCNLPFAFTAGEQKFYIQRKLAMPKRCPSCREERRRQGTYGAQVVSVDSASGLVLCKRCSRPASREVSMKGVEALCAACASGDSETRSTSNEDLLPYEDWEAHFNTTKTLKKEV